MKIAIIFPGQGSQSVGMGKDFYDNYEFIRKYYDEAKEIVGYDIKEKIFEGPQEILMQTEYTQPCIFLTSYVIFEVLKKECNKIVENTKFVAGHSLGEYTAVCVSGALNFHETLSTVTARGKIMSEVSKKRPGGMLAIVGDMSKQEIQDICDEIKKIGYIVEPVNFNTPQQTVVAGELEGLNKLQNMLTEKKVKVIKLNVSGAFHSSLMNEAQHLFAEILDKLEIKNSMIPIVFNYDAKPHTDSEEIRTNLKLQINHPVLWVDTIRYIGENGVDTFIECGPGKVLAGMIKKILPEAKIFNVDTINNFQSTIDNLRQFF
ncbi:MAG: ACP S-malonyltransferase [Endomicrobia bacterium]|nr:ACP S-malonyltransferase [Endomicrobiia bacterium]MCX7941462.1 ACP S-malonyltransferase [Endomicrobiia bacterium]MDW8055434.1 ACP S-malonyltransferase [Elusimicrobiota bacterium]